MRLGKLGPGGKLLLIAAQLGVAIIVYAEFHHSTLAFFIALIAGLIVRVWLVRNVFR